jgi:hypothetical protein
VDFGPRRLESERRAVALGGFGELAGELAGDTQVKVDLGVVRVERGCEADQLDGNVAVTVPVGQDAEQVKGIGKRRLAIENLPAKVFRLAEPPGDIMLSGERHRVR